MQPGGYAVPAEQHDTKKGRLEEKGGQYFIADERRYDISDRHREAAEIRPELVGEHDARDHAHCEGDSENLGPEAGERTETLLATDRITQQECRDEGRQADGEGGENNVEGDGECELQPGQQDSVEVHVN